MKKYKKTYIEITNSCNLSCEFCPKTNRKIEFMNEEIFIKILEEIKGHSEHIYFHVLGEPFLHPKLNDFLDLSFKYGYKVNLTTNGTLVKNVGDMLLSKPALRQVNFSLHSFNANDKSCFNKEYSMDEYLTDIFDFVHKAIKNDNPLICFRLWNLDAAASPSNDVNTYILERIQKFFKLDYQIKDQVTHCRGIKLFNNVFLNQAERFEWPDMSLKEQGDEGFCLGLRDQIAILVDGTVVPCCLDREGVINLGNINEGPFNKIIGGDRARRLYDGFTGKKVKEELCSRCSYRTRF